MNLKKVPSEKLEQNIIEKRKIKSLSLLKIFKICKIIVENIAKIKKFLEMKDDEKNANNNKNQDYFANLLLKGAIKKGN